VLYTTVSDTILSLPLRSSANITVEFILPTQPIKLCWIDAGRLVVLDPCMRIISFRFGARHSSGVELTARELRAHLRFGKFERNFERSVCFILPCNCKPDANCSNSKHVPQIDHPLRALDHTCIRSRQLLLTKRHPDNRYRLPALLFHRRIRLLRHKPRRCWTPKRRERCVRFERPLSELRSLRWNQRRRKALVAAGLHRPNLVESELPGKRL
jgi:hypothetical protein